MNHQPPDHSAVRCARQGFSLFELLVVVGIIGLLFGLSLPAIKAISRSDSLTSAARQLSDDLAFARLKAITERTTVYVVFVPDNNWLLATPAGVNARLFNNLIAGRYTDYALYTPRTVGDQPGNKDKRYLTDWRSLPEGVFLVPTKFTANYSATNPMTGAVITVNAFPYLDTIPFPEATDNFFPNLPYIAFNSSGLLVTNNAANRPVPTFRDAILPLTRGSIFNPKDANELFIPVQPLDVVETPRGSHLYNYTHINLNAVTGRARVERPEMQ